MPRTATQSGIPRESFFKLVFVGYLIGSIVFAFVLIIFEFLVSSTDLLYQGLSDLLLYAIVGIFLLAIQAFFTALVTALGLWLFERFRELDVLFVD